MNKIQIDDVNFIEHIQHRAFNEGTRLQSSVFCAQNLTKTKVKILGADAIYAPNKKRTFTSSNKIQTDFVCKGKACKDEEQHIILSKEIKKERATRLEGSFSKEKEHYHVKQIKAKTQKSEILWIFLDPNSQRFRNLKKHLQSAANSACLKKQKTNLNREPGSSHYPKTNIYIKKSILKQK